METFWISSPADIPSMKTINQLIGKEQMERDQTFQMLLLWLPADLLLQPKENSCRVSTWQISLVL
jgi:hypothetical protein